MGFCAKCGKELPAAATFCPACGTPVPGTSGSTAQASTAPAATGLDALTKDSGAQSYWVSRVIAYIVDGILVAIPSFIIGFILAFFIAFGFGFYGFIFGGFTFLFGLLFILYFAFTESMWGASFGKRFLKLKVVNKNGATPTFMEAFIRNVSKIFFLLLILDVIVGLATSKGYQEKYTDRMAGTKVVTA